MIGKLIQGLRATPEKAVHTLALLRNSAVPKQIPYAYQKRLGEFWNDPAQGDVLLDNLVSRIKNPSAPVWRSLEGGTPPPASEMSRKAWNQQFVKFAPPNPAFLGDIRRINDTNRFNRTMTKMKASARPWSTL